jgi:heat-inducible transcriptional repressor
MLDERKTAILRAVVQEYIATAQPVGSTHVANAPGVKVSSATVRNEMAVLEQEGYLVQPHTSAGRVPTDKGYRFFVDGLTPQGMLDTTTVSQVGAFFDTAHGRLEEMLSRTSGLVANLTNYAAVVMGPKPEAAVIRSIQVVALTGRLAMVVAVLSNGSVETENLELTDSHGDAVELDESRVSAATAHLQAAFVGTSLRELEDPPASGDTGLDELCAAAVSALRTTSTEDPVYVGGAAAMADSFEAVEVVRQVLHTLEQQYVVVSLVRDILNRGLSVAIGAEHGVEPLAACSVVVSPVMVDGEQMGTVGVLGPTRMNYPQALATVEVVSDRLGRRLMEG